MVTQPCVAVLERLRNSRGIRGMLLAVVWVAGRQQAIPFVLVTRVIAHKTEALEAQISHC